MRLLLALLFALVATPALAHPHIFIDAKATIVFNDAGEVTGIRNSWTFDEAFSVWQTQGLDTNGDGVTSSEEMQELAEENLQGLAEYGFYTSAGAKDETVPMASMDDARFIYENGRSTLTFGIEPQAPYRINDALEIAIYDPEYYVAITFAGVADVTLENAPEGCGLRLEPIPPTCVRARSGWRRRYPRYRGTVRSAPAACRSHRCAHAVRRRSLRRPAPATRRRTPF